jgi:hypothetical protein
VGGGVGQQGVLADAGLTPDDRRAAASAAGAGEQPGDAGAFLVASIQHGHLDPGAA